MTLCPPVHLKDLCWDCVTPSAARREQNQTLPLGWLTSAYAAAPPQVKGWTTGKKEQKRAGTWRREIFDDNWSNINSQSRFTDTPESSCEKNKNIFAGVGDQCQSELMSSFLKKKKEKPKKKKRMTHLLVEVNGLSGCLSQLVCHLLDNQLLLRLYIWNKHSFNYTVNALFDRKRAIR